MTNEALGGAPAPADKNSAAISAETATHNNPISVQLPETEAPKPQEKPTASDAIKAAQAKLTEKEAAVKAEPAKPATQPKEIAEAPAKAKSAPEPVVTEAAQSEARPSRYEAPARFNDTGKADWLKTPESVQAEVHRTVKNLEDGYTKHREAAERYEAVREYDEMARQNGRAGLHESLKQITEIESAFSRNPVDGFQRIAAHFGVDLNKVAHHIANIDPDQRLEHAQRENQALREQIQQIHKSAQMPSLVDEFRAGKDRFDELQDDIAFLLKNMVKDGDAAHRLETAYELAARMKPASPAIQTPAPAASPAAETASPAQARPNPAGQKSITGAPSSSAQPGKQRRLSTSEAIKAAMAQN